MLVGSEEVIRYARWVRKSIGGGMRQIGPIVNAARTAYQELFPNGIRETHRKAKVVEVGTSIAYQKLYQNSDCYRPMRGSLE